MGRGRVRERLNHWGNRRKPRWRGCGSRGGVWVQRYSKRSSSSGTTQAGGEGRIGCCRCDGMLSGSRRDTCHMVGLLHQNISCPQALKNNAVASVWTFLVEGSVVLFSACKVAVPNAEGFGFTDRGRGRWRQLKCRHGPGLKMNFWH